MSKQIHLPGEYSFPWRGVPRLCWSRNQLKRFFASRSSLLQKRAGKLVESVKRLCTSLRDKDIESQIL